MGDRVIERVEEVGQDHAERKPVEVLPQVFLTVFEVQHFSEVETVNEHVHLQKNVFHQFFFIFEQNQFLDVFCVNQFADLRI